MQCVERPMTVVGLQSGPGRDLLVIRTRASHYSHAVEHIIDEVVDEFREETFDHEEEDVDPMDNSDEWLAQDRAGESFLWIKVYDGQPPEGSDDISGLKLLHEE